MRKNIYLPHLNYTVKVREFKKAPNTIGSARAYVSRNDSHFCTVFLPKKASPGTVAHELVHVLQHICAVRHIEFVNEDEHMGYIMQYLMGQILGYEWAK